MHPEFKCQLIHPRLFLDGADSQDLSQGRDQFSPGLRLVPLLVNGDTQGDPDKDGHQDAPDDGSQNLPDSQSDLPDGFHLSTSFSSSFPVPFIEYQLFENVKSAEGPI
jgi:hypothetical protein